MRPLTQTTHGFPTSPTPVFLSHAFPIENRPGLHDQDVGSVCRELARLHAAHLLDAPAEQREALVAYLSDWHLLAFLGQSGMLGADEMALLATLATKHDTGSTLDALLQSSGFRTMLAIADEYDAQPPTEPDHDAVALDGVSDASHSDGDAGAGGFACPHCTFINPRRTGDCEVCGLPLGS